MADTPPLPDAAALQMTVDLAKKYLGADPDPDTRRHQIECVQATELYVTALHGYVPPPPEGGAGATGATGATGTTQSFYTAPKAKEPEKPKSGSYQNHKSKR